VSNIWVVASESKTTKFKPRGYGERHWLDDKLNYQHHGGWNDVIHPSNTYGSKLRRIEDGQILRKQEMPFTSTCHAICLFTNQGDRMIDPFAGSGVVGMCGMRLKRPTLSLEMFHDTELPAMQRNARYWAWCKTHLKDRALFEYPTQREQQHPYHWLVGLFFYCVCFFLISARSCCVLFGCVITH
jgi:DNA modification methylase